MSKGSTVERNLIGSLEVPDWEIYAAQLQEKAAHDESARELLAGLCNEFPELKAKVGTNTVTPDATPRPKDKPLKKAA